MLPGFAGRGGARGDRVAADRWAWLIIAVYAQLRLARPLAADLRRPWERPCEPHKLTPARVRRDFRHLRPKAARLSHGFYPVKVKSASWACD